LYEVLDQRLKQFIDNEENRHKNFTPNLGALVSYLFASKKYKFKDLINLYMGE